MLCQASMKYLTTLMLQSAHAGHFHPGCQHWGECQNVQKPIHMASSLATFKTKLFFNTRGVILNQKPKRAHATRSHNRLELANKLRKM